MHTEAGRLVILVPADARDPAPVEQWRLVRVIGQTADSFVGIELGPQLDGKRPLHMREYPKLFWHDHDENVPLHQPSGDLPGPRCQGCGKPTEYPVRACSECLGRTKAA